MDHSGCWPAGLYGTGVRVEARRVGWADSARAALSRSSKPSLRSSAAGDVRLRASGAEAGVVAGSGIEAPEEVSSNDGAAATSAVCCKPGQFGHEGPQARTFLRHVLHLPLLGRPPTFLPAAAVGGTVSMMGADVVWCVSSTASPEKRAGLACQNVPSEGSDARGRQGFALLCRQQESHLRTRAQQRRTGRSSVSLLLTQRGKTSRIGHGVALRWYECWRAAREARRLRQGSVASATLSPPAAIPQGRGVNRARGVFDESERHKWQKIDPSIPTDRNQPLGAAS